MNRPTVQSPKVDGDPWAAIEVLADVPTCAALKVDLALEDLAAGPATPRCQAAVALLAVLPDDLVGLGPELSKLAA